MKNNILKRYFVLGMLVMFESIKMAQIFYFNEGKSDQKVSTDSQNNFRSTRNDLRGCNINGNGKKKFSFSNSSFDLIQFGSLHISDSNNGKSSGNCAGISNEKQTIYPNAEWQKNENEKRSIVKNDEHSRTRRESTSYLETNTRQYDSQARIDTSCRRKETKNKSKTTQDLSIFCDKDIRRNEEEIYQRSQHTGIKNQLFSHEKEKSKSEINWNKTVTKKENCHHNLKTVTSEDEPLRNRDCSPESITSIESFFESDEEIGKLMPSLNLESFITTISDNKKALNLRKENFIQTIHPNSKEQSKTRSDSSAIQQDITQENLFD
ncbi:hypothetical protein CWI37_0026p0040 [Hamiltosporidium tvaerminnensis]|uniref:Uncharacterized protein n=1 Tax=Hamiltosporidium tvaerminnensis TaxID=1176355 RepID=A0A4Q9LCI7_9MICR|nr:hypothetical protein CWI37_0026p0040 [Hamiltosporidium tvaerminnensis]